MGEFASSVGQFVSSVTHLSRAHGSNQEVFDRPRIDSLQYDPVSSAYSDYYYNTYNFVPSVPPTDALIAPPPTANPYSSAKWARHATRYLPRPNIPPYFPSYNPPRPLEPPKNYLERRVDGLTTIASPITAYLPLLASLPVVAAASYYLILQNGPTPVVKERRNAKGFDWSKKIPTRMVTDILLRKSDTRGFPERRKRIPYIKDR